MPVVNLGDPAPDFLLPAHGNKEEFGPGHLPDPEKLLWVLSDLRGQ